MPEEVKKLYDGEVGRPEPPSAEEARKTTKRKISRTIKSQKPRRSSTKKATKPSARKKTQRANALERHPAASSSGAALQPSMGVKSEAMKFSHSAAVSVRLESKRQSRRLKQKVESRLKEQRSKTQRKKKKKSLKRGPKSRFHDRK